MLDRTHRISWLGALACAVLLSAGGCQKHGNQNQGEGGFTDEPIAPAKDDRIREIDAGAVGLQPGYMDGAMMYGSVRAGAMVSIMQTVPITPRDAKVLGEAGTVLGVDLRTGDVLAHVGIDPDARVSMSVRPVLTWAAEVRQTLEQGGGIVVELVRQQQWWLVEQRGHSPSCFWNPGAPPPLSPAACEFERKALSLGMHLRVHLPVATPGKLDDLLALANADLRESDGWATTCAALGEVRMCGGQGDRVVVVRDVPGGLQLDMLLTFESDNDNPDDEFRRAAIQQALSVPAATNAPAVAALRGDMVGLIDAPEVVNVLRAASLARMATPLDDDDQNWFERERGIEEAVRQFHETERMFEGVSLEVQLGDDVMLATGRWLPTDYGRQHMKEVFALSEIDTDVPSIAALCEGALLCGRSRGLPARERFGSLATGIYGTPLELVDRMDRYEEEAATVLFLETWPNAIGTLAKLSGDGFDPPESIMVENVIELSSRMVGGGFSVRSLDQRGRNLSGDWVAFARMSSTDLSAISGFPGLAEVRLAPASIPDVAGRVEFARIPASEIGGNYYAVFDPSASTGDWGWAVLADDDERVQWLLGRKRDDGAVPLVYVESGDLWRLVSSFEDGREDLGFAQSWLSRRWIRSQVALDPDGTPVVRMAMGKLD